MSCRCALIGIEACVVLWTGLSGLGIHVRCSLLLGHVVKLVFVGVNWKQFNIISANY